MQAQEIRLHAEGCEPCRDVLDSIEYAGVMMRGASISETPARLINRWCDLPRRWQDRSLRHLASALTAAAAAVLFTATILKQPEVDLPLVGDWETVALGSDQESDSEDHVAAQWIALDLSLSRGGERP